MKDATAIRVELRCLLPVCHLRDAEEQIVIDPDERAADTATDPFAFFRQINLTPGVVNGFTDRTLRSRTYERMDTLIDTCRCCVSGPVTPNPDTRVTGTWAVEPMQD